MGKAIKNFKDSISGIEEAKFRKLDATPEVATSNRPASTASAEPAITQNSQELPKQAQTVASELKT